MPLNIHSRLRGSMLWLFAVGAPFLALSATVSTEPAPLVISPSQYWDGNDGPWSSFTLQVGTPSQDVRVLISTAGNSAWVVVPQGCITSDPSNCPDSRGQIFNPNSSTTWKFKDYYELMLENNLDYQASGEFGFDTVGIGWQGSGGPVLDSQVVGGIATEEFWLGVFGLVPRPINFTDFNDPQPSFMQTLKNKSMIPSMSWGYTAGAPYRLEKVEGSLVLGGYDSSKSGTSNISFSFDPDISRDLTVGLQAVSADFGQEHVKLLPEAIYTFIDSTVPHIWLPVDACQEFEKAFNLTWNSTVGLYLVNDTLHNSLLSQNATFTFQIGNSTTGGLTMNFTLPYASFDLTIDYPVVTNRTHYFPIMRAANDSQYTLGRTFLQETYVTADYERYKFYLSQTIFDPNAQQHIIAIPSLNSTLSTPSSSHPLSISIVVGITIACLVVGLAVIIILLIFSRRRKAHKEAKRLSEVPPYTPGTLVEAFGKAELDAVVGGSEAGDKPPERLEASPSSLVQSPVYEMTGEGFEMQELSAFEHPHEVELSQASPVSSPPTSPMERAFEMRGNEANITELAASVERPHEIE